MKKPIFITNIIRTLLIFIFLVFAFVKSEQLSFRLMIGVFLLLISCNLAKNLCNLMDKPKLANIFHKLFVIIFLLFGLSFLIIWSYASIKEKQYFPILFTIPLLVFIIYLFGKYVLEIKPNPKQLEKRSRFNFKIIVSAFLVISVLLSGIICLVIGIKDTYRTTKITKNYLTTTGYFKNYEVYDTNEKAEHGKTKTYTTYRLIYVYEIDDIGYSIKTDYGSGSIPSLNSKREIKYNPSNPSEAILVGTNRNSGLIYFGSFFLLGGLVFVIGYLYTKGVFDKVRINVLGLYIGFVMFIIGIGIIAFQLGEAVSLIEIIKRMRFWIIIPIMFIVIGGFQIIKCLFFERLNMDNNSQK